MCDFGDASIDDAIGRWFEVFGKEIGQKCRDCGADLRWFKQGRASGSYGADKWLQAESNRVVPGSFIHASHKRRMYDEETIETHETIKTTPFGRFSTVGDQLFCQSGTEMDSSLAHSSSSATLWVARRAMGPISPVRTSKRGFRRSTEKAWTKASTFSWSMRTTWLSWCLRHERGRVVPVRRVSCKMLYACVMMARVAHQSRARWVNPEGSVRCQFPLWC